MGINCFTADFEKACGRSLTQTKFPSQCLVRFVNGSFIDSAARNLAPVVYAGIYINLLGCCLYLAIQVYAGCIQPICNWLEIIYASMWSSAPQRCPGLQQ